jgi:hypothetical protein
MPTLKMHISPWVVVAYTSCGVETSPERWIIAGKCQSHGALSNVVVSVGTHSTRASDRIDTDKNTGGDVRNSSANVGNGTQEAGAFRQVIFQESEKPIINIHTVYANLEEF